MITANEQRAYWQSLGDRLACAILGIRNRLRMFSNIEGRLMECHNLVLTERAFDGEAHLPGPTPTRRACPSKKPMAIVLYEVKLAIVRWWELIRTGVTIDLNRLLEQLEDYAAYGLDTYEVLGNDADGYTLFSAHVRDNRPEILEVYAGVVDVKIGNKVVTIDTRNIMEVG